MPFPIDESRNQSSPEHLQLVVGQRLFNRRYELIEMLGPGGMGVVWKAHDLARQEPKPVALKFLPSILVHHEKEMKALLAEVDAGQNLRHDLIVATYGLEVEGPLAAIVLEFVAGETLKHKLEVHERGFFEPNEIESWLKDIITALTYLHEEKGVLHRDIKPANIIVDEAVKRARLMDFGISQSIQETMGRHTQTGAAQGTSNTLAYTSPEGLGLRHKPAKTDDIYSLGATVYGLLTGTPPFCQGTPEIIALHIKTEPVPNVMQRRAELVEDGMNATVGATVPSPWQAMLDACLAKDPAKRPQSVKGMDWGGAKVAVAFSRHSEATGEAESQTNLPPTAPPFQRASPLAEAPPSAKTPALKPATTRALWQRKSILMKLVAASLVCLLTYAWWAHSSAEAERLRQEGADFERRAADKLALAERAKEQAKQAGELKASLLEREKGELRQKLLDALKPKTANSLGMKFIFFLDDKLTHKQILGCIHETRVADLAAFRADPKWQNFYADSTHSNERKANLWKERGSKENHPATDVSYIDACAFCAWLTQRERGLGLIGRDDLYRLPTDLEWSMMVGIGEQEDPSLTP
jgi:serine/threonine protein kinase